MFGSRCARSRVLRNVLADIRRLVRLTGLTAAIQGMDGKRSGLIVGRRNRVRRSEAEGIKEDGDGEDRRVGLTSLDCRKISGRKAARRSQVFQGPSPV